MWRHEACKYSKQNGTNHLTQCDVTARNHCKKTCSENYVCEYFFLKYSTCKMQSSKVCKYFHFCINC